MEPKPRSVSMNALYYGILTGAASIVLALILYIAGLYMNRSLGYLSLLLLIGGMAWGTLEYRKNYLGGFISYGKSFTSCFMIGLFAGILGAIYMFIFARFIYPGFAQEILDKAQQQMLEKNPNMSDSQIEIAMKYTRMFTSPVMMAVWGLLANVFFSVVLGLLVSIFIRKEDKSMSQNVM
ncbi:MAG TPA: DUF4199 domain-containing protein [Bacteroidales bacterium]|nr:DUF4199 domain-containing protein [Bacteroidales bacterium]